MEQNSNFSQPWQGGAPVQPEITYPAQRKEIRFGIAILISSMLLANCFIFGGPNLGFAIAVVIGLTISVGYLRACGHKLRGYPAALLALCVVIAAGFARSDDGFVKFVMICFLLVAVNLSLALLAGQNRRNPAGVASLLDAPGVLFGLGFGKLPEALRGLRAAAKNGGTAGKKTGAVLLGAVIAVPILAVMILLLISADAAFAGLMEKLPDFDFSELIVTVLLGMGLAAVLYTRGVALLNAQRLSVQPSQRKGLHPLTVNTVLIAVCFVYLVYLFSQLAYFVGGFSGILPEGFTMAQYARRGFFEMGWLCAINLGLIALAVGLVAKETKTPLLTRILCLFIGIVTLFFVVTASAKMAMYIGAYGLTRLRVLTEVIMVFLGLATATVCVWLFVPKLPYMKIVVLLALILGAAVLWADVDTIVAAYNVSAYQCGKLETVDVQYLTSLSAGAVPYIAELAEHGNATAQHFMEENGSHSYWCSLYDDLRSWNWADWLAGKQWK